MGKRRHLSRRTALQVLYAQSFSGAPPDEAARLLFGEEIISHKNWTGFARDLANETWRRAEALDNAIAPTLQNWRLERLARIDHLILRLALCEMQTVADVPVRVTLNEYIELAKEFGTDESAAFVNGILDRLAKAFTEKDFSQPSASPAETPPPED